jgi:stage II sporulation protein D
MKRTRQWFACTIAITLAACAPRMPAPPVPVPVTPALGRDLRIGVVESASSVTLGSTGDYTISDAPTARTIATGANGTATVTRIPAGGYRVVAGSTTLDVAGPVVVTSTTGTVTINGRAYRGRGEVRLNSAGMLAGINEVPVELYLYGVVPRELGPVVFPEVEAQKVQAIAARTYALANVGRRAADGYDLRATVDDQVYGGQADEHSVSSAAVDATRGIVVTFGDALLNARYSSTSGGHTADNEESFAEAPVAYWRGVPDMPPTAGRGYVASLEAFRSAPYMWDLRTPPTPYDVQRPRYHRWTMQWTAAELSSIISTFAGRNVGSVRAINVLERGRSGRIVTLEYVTDSGSFRASRGGIRSSLKYINSAGHLVNLPSTLFFVEDVDAAPGGVPATVRIYGGGFGHGVGMAQVGAVIMAANGGSYADILRHFYTGAEIVRLY